MSKQSSKKLKALVVDDDPVLQMIMQKELGSQGIDSVCVSNGTAAIEEHARTRFDFILMDISMPEQDGLDATRWIRDLRDSYSKDIPIFAVTSFASKEHTKEILEAGFNEHFVKPFKLEEFLPCLDRYF